MTARTDPGRTLLTEIQSRCTVLYRQLAAGLDAPPSDRLRLEGMLETAHLLELAATEELDELLSSAYRESFGHDLADDFGEDWRDFFHFPQVPGFQRRAPVVPTTPD